MLYKEAGEYSLLEASSFGTKLVVRAGLETWIWKDGIAAQVLVGDVSKSSPTFRATWPREGEIDSLGILKKIQHQRSGLYFINLKGKHRSDDMVWHFVWTVSRKLAGAEQ